MYSDCKNIDRPSTVHKLRLHDQYMYCNTAQPPGLDAFSYVTQGASFPKGVKVGLRRDSNLHVAGYDYFIHITVFSHIFVLLFVVRNSRRGGLKG